MAYYLGFEVLTTVIMKNTIFWHIMLCRLCLQPAFMLVSCLAYPATLKMEAICSSETSVDFKWTVLYPRDSTLHDSLFFQNIHSSIINKTIVYST
jgi:hypothetical protein